LIFFRRIFFTKTILAVSVAWAVTFPAQSDKLCFDAALLFLLEETCLAALCTTVVRNSGADWPSGEKETTACCTLDCRRSRLHVRAGRRRKIPLDDGWA
jgi:hypothetical protein